MKTLVRLLVSSTVVAAGLVGGATAAQAAPTGCVLQTGVPADGAQVRCTSGTGEVRVVISCLVRKPGNPFEVIHYGGWVGVGAYSSRVCAGGPTLEDAWFETR